MWDEVDLPLGMALIVFFQSFGGAIFTSVRESIFLNGLVSKLHEIAPTSDASVLLRTGVTDLIQNVSPSLLSVVQESYNSVLAHVWYVYSAWGRAWCYTWLIIIQIHLAQTTSSTSFRSAVFFLLWDVNGCTPCVHKLRCV